MALLRSVFASAVVGFALLVWIPTANAQNLHAGEFCTLSKEATYESQGFHCTTGSDGRLRLFSGASASTTTSGTLARTGFDGWLLLGAGGASLVGSVIALRRRARTEV